MATKDGRSQIWYADGNGNVEGYTETVDDIIETIIETYNEHFGTDIQLWTPETKTLQVGGTVPNWNAYEKIEMSSRKVALDIQPHQPVYIFGTIENAVLYMDVDESERSWLAQNDGTIVSDRGPGISAKSYLMGLFNEQGITLTDIVANRVQYEDWQTIPDWSQYEKIG